MQTEAFQLAAHGDEFEARLAVPDDPDGRGVAVMPGAGHGPWGDIFDLLAEDAARDGAYVLRFEGWPTPDDLEAKTLREFQSELVAALERLREAGCTELSVVAKSFGGGVTLTDVPDAVDRAVLWAPATFTLGDTDRLEDALDTPFEELIEPSERRTFAPSRLADVDVPVLVIQGADDRPELVENARGVVDALPDAELVVREGEDHSFRGDDREQAVVEQTLAFLRD
ncbi:alpha/beta hydrolase [Halobacterium bonnevillei]|uniref:alpha/beta hydrolase n=1 Tax=Halobacterium bonnevillei TaxID=2692200 RepID=UPI002D7FAD42|nr:alpha/beta hydrolase [Halobacterium bonnevillei]